ncbi:hypothetical protein EVAR_30308_1 [Eumeta japonica]|uniref:Uncharacterized protein n=1 Tax=Eumeta variegata TaxID=151549 RepID=A0A4C1WBR4_EUMVA|nr:hypothetical protein EVAR_30308_1 [Eumeta japonica]
MRVQYKKKVYAAVHQIASTPAEALNQPNTGWESLMIVGYNEVTESRIREVQSLHKGRNRPTSKRSRKYSIYFFTFATKYNTISSKTKLIPRIHRSPAETKFDLSASPRLASGRDNNSDISYGSHRNLIAYRTSLKPAYNNISLKFVETDDVTLHQPFARLPNKVSLLLHHHIPLAINPFPPPLPYFPLHHISHSYAGDALLIPLSVRERR